MGLLEPSPLVTCTVLASLLFAGCTGTAVDEPTGSSENLVRLFYENEDDPSQGYHLVVDGPFPIRDRWARMAPAYRLLIAEGPRDMEVKEGKGTHHVTEWVDGSLLTLRFDANCTGRRPDDTECLYASRVWFFKPRLAPMGLAWRTHIENHPELVEREDISYANDDTSVLVRKGIKHHYTGDRPYPDRITADGKFSYRVADVEWNLRPDALMWDLSPALRQPVPRTHDLFPDEEARPPRYDVAPKNLLDALVEREPQAASIMDSGGCVQFFQMWLTGELRWGMPILSRLDRNVTGADIVLVTQDGKESPWRVTYDAGDLPGYHYKTFRGDAKVLGDVRSCEEIERSGRPRLGMSDAIAFSEALPKSILERRLGVSSSLLTDRPTAEGVDHYGIQYIPTHTEGMSAFTTYMVQFDAAHGALESLYLHPDDVRAFDDPALKLPSLPGAPS